MTLAIPTAPEELEKLLSDPAKASELVNSGQIADVVKAYAKNVQPDGGDLDKRIQTGIQTGLTDFFKANKDARSSNGFNPTAAQPAHGPRRQRGQIHNKIAPGAQLDNDFDSPSDYFRTIWHNMASVDKGGQLRAKLNKLIEVQNSFGSQVPADGGFLIPETMRAELLAVALESAVVRSRATVIPMESLRVPIPSVDSTTNNGSVFGGVVGYWTEEGQALTESQGSFGRVVLDAKKLTAYAEVPNELMQDASAFNGYFDSKFPQAVSFFEDRAFISGTGAGEPLGFLNCPASLQVTAISGQGANTIVWENCVAMYARMLPSSLANAVWLVSPDTLPQLFTMALSVGTGGAPIFISDGTAGPTMSLLGRPIIVTEKVPQLGTTGDIIFADLSYYLIGDRMQMQATSSADYRFANDKTAFRVIERVDGRPWIQSAITPANGGATLSPFVQLSSTRT